MKKQQGFTLVEIAIVMVIIGLLLGGVLKGQEIITNAKIKKLENEFNGIMAAMYSYQDRYQAFPGDDKRAKVRFGAPLTGLEGNGNGKIDDEFNPTAPASKESGYFWAHLRYAGLVVGILDRNSSKDTGAADLPFNVFGGIMGVSHKAVSAADLEDGILYIGFTGIPASIASILESQTDDLNPKTGSVRATLKAAGVTDYTAEGAYEMYFTL